MGAPTSVYTTPKYKIIIAKSIWFLKLVDAGLVKKPAHKVCINALFHAIDTRSGGPGLEISRFSGPRTRTLAGVAELVDAPDLGSGGESRGGSSPFARTSFALSKAPYVGAGGCWYSSTY
ncbi:protein of unknown function [Magnetospirillum gryphiswaldense MSR-1 v2]|uniref:Uncharacterized protein n=1 Tax=Magnetospirillum gryphiswaldense (strain DSM 6361 / JCM 21280 / NBRC 15271 / MSR-1) TaxID=431944 RepID=V6F231_MAGGM|nr:protein of unknown function [Magnetospirillum gryphiswaldense MSR-1 v2]